MKFVSSNQCQTVTDALNFSTADCHVIGSCDLYTTKAAGSDKKLYRNIENSLESQHESLVQLRASLSPPQAPIDGKRRKDSFRYFNLPDIDLSRESPFGSLDQVSARRVFAYLIATLNASHPDYDFSNILRPSDFQKTSGTHIRLTVDTTLQNMRPRRMTSLLSPPSHAALSTSAPVQAGVPSPETVWNEGMWKLIDEEMDLKHCDKYCWDPEDDPFEAEAALWSQHYFFFNKERKRVCYLYFRAFSAVSHSPVRTTMYSRTQPIPGNPGVGEGAGKRAQYWLGRSIREEEVDDWDEDDEMAVDDVADDYADEEYNYKEDLDDFREHLEDGYYSYGGDGANDEEDAAGWFKRGRSVRGSSEGLADAMEL